MARTKAIPKRRVPTTTAGCARKPPTKAGQFHTVATTTPETRMARTRLYRIKSEGTTHHTLVNAEQITFQGRATDFVKVGHATETVFVTPKQMTQHVYRVRGFCHITFVKKDGSLRCMYARCLAPPKDGLLQLEDLELDTTETRSCHMNKVVSLITDNGTKYVLKQRQFCELLSLGASKHGS